MADLTALIERLEKADGPSRELDAAVCRYLVGSPADHWYGLHGDFITDGLAPAITASIDAAVALAERVLPGWVHEIIIDGSGGIHRAICGPDRASHRNQPKLKMGMSKANAAIALVSAVLQSLSAQEGSK